ncbi:hypothetical protein BH11PAT1_BH11PAT1_0800 [soil metagenome]
MRQSALFLYAANVKLLLFTFFAISFLFFTPQVNAQTYQNSTTAPNVSSDVEQNQHTYAQTMLFDMLSATSCLLSGIDPVNEKGCLGLDPTTKKFSYTNQNNSPHPGGLAGFMTNSMGQMYNIPIHTNTYMEYMSSNFGIAPKAYAQAQGFDQLKGILGVWTIFRNLAYLFFVLILVIIGMGVMLRLKIDPRTVMSIQNQIPRLIIGLILITFSYAIAGFMVDLMWTSTYLVIRLAGQVKLPDKEGVQLGPISSIKAGTVERKVNQQKVTESLLASPFGFANVVLGRDEGGGVIGYSGSITGSIGGTVASLITPLDGSKDQSCGIFFGGGTITGCIHGALYSIIDWLTRFLGFFIVLFAVLIALGRIWWSMIKSFAYIVIYTAIAPVYIAAGLIPGSTTNFSSWVRGLVANLAVYPATVAFFLGAYIFQSTFDKNTFAPPLTGNPGAAGGFGYIVSFAILMVAPELINMLRDALKSPASKYIAPSITKGVGAGAALPGAVTRGTWGKLWKTDPYGKAIGPINTAVADFLHGRIGGGAGTRYRGGAATTVSRRREWAAKVGSWFSHR